MVPAPVAAAGEIEAIGHSLFNEHVLAFEYVSILLLVAIIGAVYLTKKRKTPRAAANTAAASESEPASQSAPGTEPKEVVPQ